MSSELEAYIVYEGLCKNAQIVHAFSHKDAALKAAMKIPPDEEIHRRFKVAKIEELVTVSVDYYKPTLSREQPFRGRSQN